MDYRRHYEMLIGRSRGRLVDCFVERHHVIPKCMGGLDDESNIARLTPEEHYIAHQLLVKMHPDNKKLVYAAWAMTHGPRRNNKKYGWLKRKRSAAQIGATHTEETKLKISAAAKGRKLSDNAKESLHSARRGSKNSDDHNRKVSLALSGKKKSEAHLAALREARKRTVYTPELREKLAANRGKKLNENQLAALLAANKGAKQTEGHKAKVSAAKKGKLQPKATCPTCHKEGGASLMRRWHFDNCKVKHG